MAPVGRNCGEGSSARAEEQPPGEATALFEITDSGGSAGVQTLWFESLALPDEKPGELRALFERWTTVYEPASVIERYLLEMIVYDLIRIRRCRRWQDAIEERLGPRASLHDRYGAGIQSARRHYAKMFHANYSLLLELQKRSKPRSAPLEQPREAGPAKNSRTHVA
jgi:hypothetical protein